MKNPNRRQALSGFELQPNSTILKASIKAKLMDGNTISVIDYPTSQRQEIIGILAALQDELPIIVYWQTLRQSYLSQTRTRYLRYRIPSQFLGIGGVL
jgi:hypothetical protein